MSPNRNKPSPDPTPKPSRRDVPEPDDFDASDDSRDIERYVPEPDQSGL